jgi:gas vesicle protein
MAQENGDKLVWLLVGAALGAAVALLYAPQSGDHTRRLIVRKARKGRDLVVEQGGDLVEKGRDFVEEHGSDLIEKGRGLYKQGKRVADEAANLVERGRRIVEG